MVDRIYVFVYTQPDPLYILSIFMKFFGVFRSGEDVGLTLVDHQQICSRNHAKSHCSIDQSCCLAVFELLSFFMNASSQVFIESLWVGFVENLPFPLNRSYHQHFIPILQEFHA